MTQPRIGDSRFNTTTGMIEKYSPSLQGWVPIAVLNASTPTPTPTPNKQTPQEVLNSIPFYSKEHLDDIIDAAIEEIRLRQQHNVQPNED